MSNSGNILQAAQTDAASNTATPNALSGIGATNITLARSSAQNPTLLKRYTPVVNPALVCQTNFMVPLDQDRLASQISNFYADRTGGRQCLPENITVELMNAVRKDACQMKPGVNEDDQVKMCMLTSYAYGRALASRIEEPIYRADPCIRTGYLPSTNVYAINKMIEDRTNTTLQAANQTAGI